MHELVTVVITTYKRPVEILSRAVTSVINQTYENVELFVVDDNRDDDTCILIKNYIDNLDNVKVHYIKNGEPHGACSARNRGALAGKGKYIAFLDDDDEWKDSKLQEMLPAITGDIGFVYCGMDTYREEKKIEDSSIVKIGSNLEYQILKGNFIGGCSIPVIKKDLFHRIGMFDNEMQSCQDWDLWIRVIKNSSITYLEKPLVNYYITDNSITRNYKKQNAGRLRILEKYKADYCKYPELKERIVNAVIITKILDNDYRGAMIDYRNLYRGMKQFTHLPIVIKAFVKKFINAIRGYN